MKTLLTLTAVAALSLGLAGTASATAPGAEIGPQLTTESSIAQAGHRCYYRYFYVTNGYQYRYFYRWYCY